METFCHNCDKFVNVCLREHAVEIPIARNTDEKIWCLEFYTICSECGKELYLPCVNDINVLLREREIDWARKQITKITQSMLQEIKGKLI